MTQPPTEPSTPRPRAPGPFAETLASLRRLPDLRAALEALGLFILVLLAGAWAANDGVLTLNPLDRTHLQTLWLSAFLMPALVEELVFRSWIGGRGADSSRGGASRCGG